MKRLALILSLGALAFGCSAQREPGVIAIEIISGAAGQLSILECTEIAKANPDIARDLALALRAAEPALEGCAAAIELELAPH